MTNSKLLGLLLGVAVTCVAPASGASPAIVSSQTICQATASAARQAARHDAHDAYWLQVALCLNGPHSGDCQHEAHEALHEALDLADEQYHARLEVCGCVGQGAYNPEIDPDDFSANVTNPYLPLVPGRTLVYEGQTAEGLEHVEVTTLQETVEIDGVECRAVHDVVTRGGAVVEDTMDFFAQHENGTVWYFGEISQSFEDGFLDNLDGSWRTGKDGAKPGKVMLGNRHVDDCYRQEFLVGEAEDIAKILTLNETVHVAYGTFQHCVQTKEWTPLEPDAFEKKFYASGIGVILELDPQTGERLELIQVIN